MSRKRPRGAIEELLAAEQWFAAQRLLEKELAASPQDHWLLARLSLVHYEQHNYTQALALAVQSTALMPACPLALWELAGALDMVGRVQDALRIYQSLLATDSLDVAADPCWESPAWAAALKADCLFRLGCCHLDLGQRIRALRHFVAFLSARSALVQQGIRTIYEPDDLPASAGVPGALEAIEEILLHSPPPSPPVRKS